MSKKRCSVKGCHRISKIRGFCQKHYKQIWLYGKIKEKICVKTLICKYPGCNNPHTAKGYCNRHYQHLYHYGYIKKRTKTDPNNFIFEDDICKIELFDNNGQKTADAIIDIEDYNLVKDRKWYLRKWKKIACVVSGNGATFIRLHKLITGTTKKELIDHKDRNILNNRKYNLRKCTSSQNSQNASIGKQNTSGVKNVSWDKEMKKWRVEIGVKRKSIFIGRFKLLEDAEQAAIKARQQYHGNFACNG